MDGERLAYEIRRAGEAREAERDRFVLSKDHAALGLYAVLAATAIARPSGAA